MSLLCRRRVRNVPIAVAWLLAGAGLMHRAEATARLNVCIDQANPTVAMDTRVVHAAAESQGFSINLVPFTGVGKGGDGFPIGRFSKMAASECQLIMGFPVDVGHPDLPPTTMATVAYASTGFVLVSRASTGSVSLKELRAGSEVGIAQLDTYAGLLFSDHPNVVMHVYPDDADMLADLKARHIVAGLAWQPSIERYQRMHPKQMGLNIRILPGKHMLWNIVALYAPESRSAADVFERGLEQLQSDGRLARLVKPFQRAAAAGASDLPKTSSRVAAPPDKKRRGPAALYTEEQAKMGELDYYQNCAMCHGPLLDGQLGGYSGPALKGAEFADPSYDFHVADIFNFVAKLMPPGTPGSLPPEKDVAIMAYILQQNGYPAGSKELKYDEAAKSRVPLRYYGK